MQQEGLGSDAGRPSLTEVGANACAHSAPACRLCGAVLAAGTKFCPHCGAIHRSPGPATDTRALATAPLPPLPPLPVSRTLRVLPSQGAPDANGPSSPPSEERGAAGPPIPPAPVPLRRPATAVAGATPHGRGERLVAWSAIGVLVIAGFYMVDRVGRLADEAEPRRTTAALAPPTIPATGKATDMAAAPAREEEPTSPTPPRRAEAAVDAVRHASKPAARAVVPATRKAPARAVSRATAPSPPSRVSEPAVLPAAPRVEQVLVAAASERPQRSPWDTMRDELAACPSEDFIEEVMCRQRIRIRFCPGWWGQVRECPSRQGPYGG